MQIASHSPRATVIIGVAVLLAVTLVGARPVHAQPADAPGVGCVPIAGGRDVLPDLPGLRALVTLRAAANEGGG